MTWLYLVVVLVLAVGLAAGIVLDARGAKRTAEARRNLDALSSRTRIGL